MDARTSMTAALTIRKCVQPEGKTSLRQLACILGFYRAVEAERRLTL